MRIYLAGPDVFLPAAAERAIALKAVCARHGLTGVSPLDPIAEHPDWERLSEARRIALRNEAHIAGCDALVANLTPFRGPSADAGTVFELGYMRALGRPVFGWSNAAEGFTERTLAFLDGRAVAHGDGWRDHEGMLLESFGLFDNLMLDGAVLASGGVLVTEPVAPERRWHDLAAFERCIAAVAATLVRRARSG